jgi:hypothetical protein
MKLYKARNVELEKWVIIGSGTVQVGDPVKITAASVDAADATTDLMYGLCVGIVDATGIPLEVASAANFSDGTYTTSTQEYAAAADNATDKMVCALVHPFDGTETLTALADATIGTTTGSDKPGYYIDVLTSDSTKLDESNTHASNVLQFVTVDNGTGKNSCQNPVLGGNWILVKPREVQVPGAQG